MSLLLFWRQPDVTAEITALQERIAQLELQLERAQRRLAKLVEEE